MALFQNSGGLRRVAMKEETKNCPLCGALNYHQNRDCITCGWHGAFDKDPAVIDFQWQRLQERYEEVRLEHLTAKRSPGISEFGVARRQTLWRRIETGWGVVCQRLTAIRASRTASPRPNSVLPPK